MVIRWGDDTETVGAGHAPKARTVRTAASTQARGAYEQGSRPDLAKAFKVKGPTISHRKNGDHKDPVAQVCEAVMELGDDTAARALLAAVEAAYERRTLLRSETPVLLTKYVTLWYREHDLDADEDKECARFMGGAEPDSYDAALRRHGTTLHLLAEIRDELESRGVDTRTVLLQPQAAR